MSNPDYTDDDLAILRSGSWGAEPDVPAESGTPDEPGPAEPEPETAEQADEEKSIHETEAPSEARPQPGPPPTAAQPAVAASANQVARVELQPGGIKAAIEAILAVADVPVSVREFSAALIVSERAVETALDQLRQDYRGYDDAAGTHEPRGFELRQVASGWRLYAREDFSPWVGRFVVGTQTVKLTRAALETLAVIAYQQPTTRSYISQVRGISSDAAVRNLLTRGFIAETVPDETGATQYITTDTLLEKLGLNSLDELPALAPYLPDPGQVASTETID